jgi:nucleotide-binding universal stress UspA family protein
MITIQQILCPVDFSDFSRHALDHAAAIAKWYDAALTVLHVVAPVLPPAIAPSAPLFPSVVFTAEDLEQFRQATEAFVREEVGNINATAVAREGSVAAEVVRLADSLGCDLLVMGTHGRSGFEHLMLGSVTERIIRKAPCPVLTVPPRVPDVVPSAVAYKRILCPIDFSPSSLKALTYAVSLAEEADATLTLLAVVEHHVFEGDDTRRRLRELVGDDVRTYAEVRERVVTGKPYREILHCAENDATELIVIGTHGASAGTVAFGSTTNQVVRQASCPVLSLRA